MNVNIQIPQGPIADPETGAVTLEWNLLIQSLIGLSGANQNVSIFDLEMQQAFDTDNTSQVAGLQAQIDGLAGATDGNVFAIDGDSSRVISDGGRITALENEAIFFGLGGGTVTRVAETFTGGLISVAGSPINTSGTLALTVAGTSGGIPYFSSASTWASSGALTAGAFVTGGGAGTTPSVLALGTANQLVGVNSGATGNEYKAVTATAAGTVYIPQKLGVNNSSPDVDITVGTTLLGTGGLSGAILNLGGSTAQLPGISIGQDSTHSFQVYWIGNATPLNGRARFETAGFLNPLDINSSITSINGASLAPTVIGGNVAISAATIFKTPTSQLQIYDGATTSTLGAGTDFTMGGKFTGSAVNDKIEINLKSWNNFTKTHAALGIVTTSTASSESADLYFAVKQGTGNSYPTELMRLTSDNHLLINDTTAKTLGTSNFVQIAGTTAATNSLGISAWSADALGSRIELGKSRGATIGTNTIVVSGDVLGTVTAYGANGSTFTNAAQISFESDGTPGATNDMPGRVVFKTTPDGSGTLTEAMRLSQDQTALFASTIKTPSSGSGAGAWLLGQAISGIGLALNTTSYVEVKIDGVVAKLAQVL